MNVVFSGYRKDIGITIVLKGVKLEHKTFTQVNMEYPQSRASPFPYCANVSKINLSYIAELSGCLTE